MLVLGGALYHRGGLESFCLRATDAVNAAQAGWSADWWPTDAAYVTAARLPGVARRLRAVLGARGRYDLIWLQWSTLPDLAFLIAARALGTPVLVTPHLGANARLQRVGTLRRLCARLLRSADRIALLFAGQQDEIALPGTVPRSIIRTFLPQASITQASAPKPTGALRLIHAGRLSEGKGTFRTVALCAALRARGIACSAQIVGRADPATMARLRTAIDAAGLNDVIELIAWLGEQDLIRALGEADVLAHLSILDSFPLIVLEAMAAGAVPVVGAMAGARAMVDAYGGYVVRDSAADDAADWLAAQPLDQLRRDGTVMASKVRADHRWPACAAQAIAAADATLERRARGRR